MKRFCQTHYILASLLAAAALAVVLTAGHLLWLYLGPDFTLSPLHALQGAPFWLLWTGVVALFGCYPFVLTGIQVCLLLRRPDGTRRGMERIFDAITLCLGVGHSALYLLLLRSVVWTEWSTVLRNSEVHAPICPQFSPTIAALALTGLVGYLLLTYLPLKKLPPLAIVLSIAGMYLACGTGIVWSLQICRELFDLLLLLLPLNLLLITARTIRAKMAEWNALPPKPSDGLSPLLKLTHNLLCKSMYWPLLAFLLMWPLLGVLICILALFGQAPSAVIRAWTETSDWNLSQRVAPQNIYYDEHYLCTVAAGGHRKLVKPLRLGVRHGHQVIVNRQLCVANAFEQVLEEHTPRFHRAVRHFYDTYGFPIARLIHSPWLADVIYVLMKPLEWLFLLVLYCTDVCPEDRIALQYTGKSLKDFQSGREALDGPAPQP